MIEFTRQNKYLTQETHYEYLSDFNSSGKFSDTFSSLFSALGLCSLLRRAGFKREKVMVLQ